MAFEIPGFKLGTQVAGADLRAAQYKFVTVDSDGEIVLAGDGGRAIGVLNNKPNTGQPAEVICTGVAKVSIGAEVEPGEWVSADDESQAEPAAAQAFVLGMALDGASNEDEIISVLLMPGGVFELPAG